MTEIPIGVQQAVMISPLSRQQIIDGIESRALPAVNRAKPGSQRRHYRIYPSDLQAYARSLAGADS